MSRGTLYTVTMELDYLCYQVVLNVCISKNGVKRRMTMRENLTYTWAHKGGGQVPCPATFNSSLQHTHTHTHTHTLKQLNTDVIVGAADGTGFFVDDRFVCN